MMCKLRHIILLGLAVIQLSACDQSYSHDSRLDQIISDGVIKVGTTGDYLPFSYRQGGSLKGVDITLAKELANSLNVKVEFVGTSWPTLMDDLLANKFDVGMSGITITDERLKIAAFSLPMHEGGKAAISRDEYVMDFDTIEEINKTGVKVIFNPGGTNERFARANFPKATLIQNEDNLSVFEKIVSGEADVMVTDAIETIIQEKLHPELEAVNPETPFNSSQKAYLIQKDEKFKHYLDEWINNIRSNGTLGKVFEEEL